VQPTPAALAYASDPAPCVAVAGRLGLELVAAFKIGGPPMVESLFVAACGGTFSTLLVERLSLLSPRPVAALRLVAEMRQFGVSVVSAAPDEGWLAEALPFLANLVRWFDAEVKGARIAGLRAAVLRSDRRPGRPRREIDPDLAAHLIARLPLDHAARELGVGASTLRRWARQRTEEEKVASICTIIPQVAA
jgi:DNA invertase Pin-like site-specific DNA recombinase